MEAPPSLPQLLRARPVMAAMMVGAFALLAERVPWLAPLRLLSAEAPPAAAAAPPVRALEVTAVGEATLVEESDGNLLSAMHGAPATAGAGTAPRAGEAADRAPGALLPDKPPPRPLEDPSGKALAHFGAALRATVRREPTALTRIAFFGDSMVASDYISSSLRRLLQQRFGDAGHGFCLVANAWPSYYHDGVTRFATSGWLLSRVVGPLNSDGWYGLGGVSFRAPPHLLARVGTATRGELGRRVSRFTIAYVEEPGGGKARIRLNGREIAILDTGGPEKRFATRSYTAPDGEHTLELQTFEGTTRLFGFVLEREQPGVVLDALGIQGARLRFLDKQNEAHFAEQLRWRNPDLLVYQFGANESADGFAVPMAEYQATMRAVLEKHRAALPGRSCLVVGALDRAEKKGDELRSLPVIEPLVEEQRRAAAAVGCAFFDTYQAMGGRGSMARWVKRDLGQADLTHPTAVGADIVGTWLFRALLDGLRHTE